MGYRLRGRGAAHGRTPGPTEAGARVRDSCVGPRSRRGRGRGCSRGQVRVEVPETRAEPVVVLSVCQTGLDFTFGGLPR